MYIYVYIYIYIHIQIEFNYWRAKHLGTLKRWMGLGNLMKHAWIARLYPLTISLRELLVHSQKRMDFFSSRNDYSNCSVHNRILIRSSDDGKAYRNPQKYSKYSGIFLRFPGYFIYVLPIFTHRLTETNGS